jgi:crossover junction endodeoxyribonuclease RusA
MATKDHIFVYGLPKAQGSKKAFVVKGRPIIVDTNSKELKVWRYAISTTARNSSFRMVKDGPVAVTAVFYMPKPKKPLFSKPAGRVGDLDKLARSLLDSLTGVAYTDDAQVTTLHVSKEYGDPTGVSFAWGAV